MLVELALSNGLFFFFPFFFFAETGVCCFGVATLSCAALSRAALSCADFFDLFFLRRGFFFGGVENEFATGFVFSATDFAADALAAPDVFFFFFSFFVAVLTSPSFFFLMLWPAPARQKHSALCTIARSSCLFPAFPRHFQARRQATGIRLSDLPHMRARPCRRNH